MIATAASVEENDQGPEALDQGKRKADKNAARCSSRNSKSNLKIKQQIERVKITKFRWNTKSARRHQIELKEKLQQSHFRGKQLLQQAQHEGREILSRHSKKHEIISKSEQQQRDLIQNSKGLWWNCKSSWKIWSTF